MKNMKLIIVDINKRITHVNKYSSFRITHVNKYSPYYVSDNNRGEKA